ncbi:odorant receptor Or2-like [Achroia grisella]|uniref:odorant receptor Or2-like n=1 Tax=Achroia grisella TaxID=688607 RepID=UPI0027D23755|nr:odorant receptor Or2-like [Achroia grisella]
MLLRKIMSFAKGLEDSEHPLLGPNLKGLYWCGCWRDSNKLRNTLYNLAVICAVTFITSEIIEVYCLRSDINKMLYSISVSILSVISASKNIHFTLNQGKLKMLVNLISTYEISNLNKIEDDTIKEIKKYTKYARVVTYTYWILVFATNIGMIVTPLIKYASAVYNVDVDSSEMYPEIISSWFPFDKTKKPGYIIASVIHILMSTYGALAIGACDMFAITVLTFIKGQLIILNKKCIKIFASDNNSESNILEAIRDCHGRHNILLKIYRLYDSLLSPVMYIYVLICSVMICCNVVQFTSTDISAAQKLWIVQYTFYLISQLFLFCWHGNQVLIESINVDRGVYRSDWWKGDVQTRKQILLLSGKLKKKFIMHAGPFTVLSVPTFIDILKASYSFYTLFSQMHDIK